MPTRPFREEARYRLFLILAALGSLLFTRCAGPRDAFLDSMDSQISPGRIGTTIETLASKPHRAGTPENRKVGDAILSHLQSFGLKTWTEESTTTLEVPSEQRLFLDGTELDLHEKVLPQDPYTAAALTELPFFAYAPDADIQAKVVYANFGAGEDYALLRKLGISVKGAIVLLRAQGICRGMKGLLAEKEGAAGMLLYPEPKDQGFRKPSYPDGPWLNPWTVMRGSMARYFLFPGNPVDSEERPGILPVIPSIPINGATAEKILRAMQGPSAPKDWTGDLNAGYSLGPGATVRMVIRAERQSQTLRNIFALIPGSHPEEGLIVAGSHYDAWVYGAADPISGVATILEGAQALSKQSRSGWKPRRSILFAFWDAEEYGMHGSTVWVRKNLAKPLVAYINIDTAVKAHDFVGSIMPGLRGSMEDALAVVRDPDTRTPLAAIRPEYTLPGFSTDATPFLGFTGVPVAELRFGRWYSLYHSLYDNPAWYRRFNDPGYRYTAALVKILCLYLRNLSTTNILPYRFSEFEEYANMFLDHNPKPDLSALRLEAHRLGEVSRRFEAVDKTDLPDASTVRINTTLLEAMRTFSAPPDPRIFGKANLLIGPSPESGCAGEPFASLKSAMQQSGSRSLNEEAARIQGAFAHCRELLEKAITITSENR